jgi:hypothetical protein
VGDSFSVSVAVDSTLPVYAWELTLTYLGALVSAGTATEGAFLSAGGATTFLALGPDNGLGQFGPVSAALNGAVPGVAGTGTLVTFTFQALAAGVAQFGVTGVTLLDETLFDISSSTSNGSVTINAATGVPEPRTTTMVALCLAYWGYRRVRTSKPRRHTSPRRESGGDRTNPLA